MILLFGSIFGPDDAGLLHVPAGVLAENPLEGTAVRIIGSGRFVLDDAAEGSMKLVHEADERLLVDLTAVRDRGADGSVRYRVVSGRISATVSEALAERLRPLPGVAAGSIAWLGPDGLEVETGVGVYPWQRMVLAHGFIRPPRQQIRSWLPNAGRVDWSRWRHEGSSNEQGDWVVSFYADVALDVGKRKLHLRLTEARWEAGTLILAEKRSAPAVRAVAAPVTRAALVLTAAEGWRPAAGFSAPLRLVPPRKADRPDDDTRARLLWLRATERSWVRLEADLHGGVGVLETRSFLLAAPEREAAAGDMRIELLPDSTEGAIEVVMDAASGEAREVRVHGAALRATVRGLAQDAGEMTEPELPAHDTAAQEGFATWLSLPSAAADSGTALITRSGGEWQLRVDADRLLAYRRVGRWLDTPPAWAANDVGVFERPSALRGLLPCRATGGAVRLRLRHGAVEIADDADAPSWVVEKIAEPDRPSFGLGENDLGLEVTRRENGAHAYRVRHAVAALDERYRSAAAELDPQARLLPLELTYVKDNGSRAVVAGLERIPAAVDGQRPERGAAQELTWAGASVLTLTHNARPLPFQLVVERNSDNSIRRWGLLGDVVCGAIPFIPVRFSYDAARQRHDLVLQSRGVFSASAAGGLVDERFLELRLSCVLQSEGIADVQETSGSARIPLAGLVPQQVDARMLWLDGDAVTMDDGALRVGGLKLWRGAPPDRSAVSLASLPPLTVLFGSRDTGDAHAHFDCPDGTYDVSPTDRLTASVAVAEGLLTSAVLRHSIAPTLSLEETIAGIGPEYALSYAGVAISRDQVDIRRHGHRLLIASAARAEASADVLVGVRASALSRVFLELGRLDSSGFEILGGMIGWEAGTLFGLQTAASASGAERAYPFPNVSMIWPGLEPAPVARDAFARDTVDAADAANAAELAAVAEVAEPVGVLGSRAAVLELNGSWSCEHSGSGVLHTMRVHCWDVRIGLTGRETPGLPEQPKLPLLVQHTITRRSAPNRFELSGFAYQIGTVTESNLLDLSACYTVEQRLRKHDAPVLAGLRRRALKGFVIDPAMLPRMSDDRDPGPALLVAVLCGPAYRGTGDAASAPALTITGPGRTDIVQRPTLAWHDGLDFLDQEQNAWLPVHPADVSTGPVVRIYGRNPGDQLDGKVLFSTLLARAADRPSLEWLPCPVRGEMIKPPADSVRHAARLWVVAADGLAAIQTFPAGPDSERLERLAATALERSGWHREAVLEHWENNDIVWDFVDSPLLNRSVSLARFSAAVMPAMMFLPRESHATGADSNMAHTAAPPRAELRDEADVYIEFPPTAGGSARFQFIREIPFAVDNTLAAFRGRLSRVGVSCGGTWLPPGPREGAPEPAPSEAAARRARPVLPAAAVIHPARPRPGERMCVGIEGPVTGGAAVDYRVLRTGPLVDEIRIVHRESAAEASLTRETIKWRTEGGTGDSGAQQDALGTFVIAGKSLLFVHAPGAAQANPAEPIMLWLHLARPWGELEHADDPDLLPGIGLQLVPENGPWTAVADTRSVRLAVEAFHGEGRALLSSARTIALTELSRGVSILAGAGSSKAPGIPPEATLIVCSVSLPSSDREWAEWTNAAPVLHISTRGITIPAPGAAAESATVRLALVYGAASATTSLGMVALLAPLTRGGPETVVAYGPEPPARPVPLVNGEVARRQVEWQRLVQWIDRRVNTDPAITGLLYLDSYGGVRRSST